MGALIKVPSTWPLHTVTDRKVPTTGTASKQESRTRTATASAKTRTEAINYSAGAPEATTIGVGTTAGETKTDSVQACTESARVASNTDRSATRTIAILAACVPYQVTCGSHTLVTMACHVSATTFLAAATGVTAADGLVKKKNIHQTPTPTPKQQQQQR